MKKKVIGILIFMILFSSIFNIPVNAEQENNDIQYKIRQVTSREEITNDSKNDYIIIYKSPNSGNLYALASEPSSTPHVYIMSRSNAKKVKIEGDILTYSDDTNIVWTFSKSWESMADGDKPVIESIEQIYSGPYKTKKQLDFVDTSSTVNGTGIKFSTSAFGVDLLFNNDEENTVKIKQDNDETEYNYLRYVSGKQRFTSCTEEDASNLQIYEVIRGYSEKAKIDFSAIPSQPEYPNPGSIKVESKLEKANNYVSNAVAKVKIDVEGVGFKKDVDLILVIDESTSFEEEVGDGSGKLKKEVVREAATEFAQTFLGLNENNRIGVIKFGNEIIEEETCDEIGLTNNIEAVADYINIDRTDDKRGTDYTAAFKKANEILEEHYEPNKEAVVVFLSDGAPNTYNRLSYTTYEHYSDWIKYYSNTSLKENDLMKESNVKIYTIGFESEVVSEDVTTSLLKKLATEESYFFRWEEYQELENIYRKISREFYEFPENAEVIDQIGNEVRLLTKKVDGIDPVIKISINDEVFETITFQNNGEEAVSSLYENMNVLTKDSSGNINISHQLIDYTGNNKTINWKIGDLNSAKYTLEYYVYLEGTTDLYSDGTSRATGKYTTGKDVYLKYTNHLNETIKEDVKIEKVDWVNQNVSQENNTPNDSQDNSQVINENGDVVKTGDELKYYIIALVVLAILFIVLRCKSNGAKHGSKK